MAGCGCKTGNLGYSFCGDLLDITSKIAFVPLFDEDGNRNVIKKTDFVGGKLPQSLLDGKVNATPDKRWYIIGDFAQASELKGDAIVYTDVFGAETELAKGSIVFDGYIDNVPNKLESKIDSFKCGDWGVYQFDLSGNIHGYNYNDDLAPLPIVNGTIKGDYVKKSLTDTNPSRLMVKYSIDKTVQFGDYETITADQIDGSVLSLSGLQDVKPIVTVVSPTELQVVFEGCYGPYNDKFKLPSLTVGDIDLQNVTTASAVVPTLADNDSVYTLTITAQTTGDVGSITATKGGFDVETVTFTYL